MNAIENDLDEKLHINTKNDNRSLEEYDSKILPELNLMEPSEDDEIWKWAENNIGENPDRKLELIEELRDMIFERGECEPHRTDDQFLLRFLRARNFKVRMAHRLIANYYLFKETHPELFYNIDFNKILEIGDSEIFSIPAYLDDQGRRMLIVRFEKWDTTQFTTDELFQCIIFLIQTSVIEPRHQILGGVCIIDVRNLGAGHAWYLTPTIVKQLISVAYSGLPHRAHAIHVVNSSKIFDYAFGVIKPFLSDFMKQKIIIHPDMESLHIHISPKHLPKRFGGIHKDYVYNDWLNVLKDNEIFYEEMTSIGYDGCKEFLQKL